MYIYLSLSLSLSFSPKIYDVHTYSKDYDPQNIS